jgi:hypothetical protein
MNIEMNFNLHGKVLVFLQLVCQLMILFLKLNLKIGFGGLAAYYQIQKDEAEREGIKR